MVAAMIIWDVGGAYAVNVGGGSRGGEWVGRISIRLGRFSDRWHPGCRGNRPVVHIILFVAVDQASIWRRYTPGESRMMAATSACMRTGVDNPEIGCPIQIGKPRMLYGYTTGIPCHGYHSD
jgi:hypothetical protein